MTLLLANVVTCTMEAIHVSQSLLTTGQVRKISGKIFFAIVPRLCHLPFLGALWAGSFNKILGRVVQVRGTLPIGTP